MWRLALIVLLALLILFAGPAVKDRCTRLLENPNIALANFIAGLLLIYVEFCFPGSVVPASIGGAMILLSLAGFMEQPWSGSALILIAFAVLLLFVEARYNTYGMIGVSAALLLIWGVHSAVPGLRLGLVATLLIPWAAITIVLLRFAWLARQNKMVSFYSCR